MAQNRRDHLIETALDLFYREGFHATGIDKILAESGVAKMTLYKHFRSKDELILAVLRRRDERFRNIFVRAVESRVMTPGEGLLAIFDVLDEWFGSADFHGCLFVNAAAEYRRADDPIHAFAGEHKRLFKAYIRELAEAAGADDAEALAVALSLLVEGAIVMASVAGQRDAAQAARQAAATLVAEAIP